MAGEVKRSEWEATMWKVSIKELGCKDRDKVPLEIQGGVFASLHKTWGRRWI